jgi:hypothetical protein
MFFRRGGMCVRVWCSRSGWAWPEDGGASAENILEFACRWSYTTRSPASGFAPYSFEGWHFWRNDNNTVLKAKAPNLERQVVEPTHQVVISSPRSARLTFIILAIVPAQLQRPARCNPGASCVLPSFGLSLFSYFTTIQPHLTRKSAIRDHSV